MAADSNMREPDIRVGEFEVSFVADDMDQSWAASTILPEWDVQVASQYPETVSPEVYDAKRDCFRMQFGGHQIRINSTMILVDAGIGACKDRSTGTNHSWHLRTNNALVASLHALGVEPEQIDYVVITHAHADHIGGLTIQRRGRWVPTFPHAQHLIFQAEIDYWLAKYRQHSQVESGAIADSLVPLLDADVITPIGTRHVIVPGAVVREYAGHTPGTCAVWLESNESSAVVCGDIIHHPVQLHQPLWSTRFCVDPVAASSSRIQLLAEAASTGATLIPNHVRTPPTRVTRIGPTSFPPAPRPGSIRR